jgi:lysosomal-associated transmembrane protein
VSDLQDSIALPPPRQIKKDDTDADGHVLTTDPSPTKTGDKSSENHTDLSIDDLSHRLHFEAHVISRHRRHFSPYFALCLSTFSLAFCCFLVHGAIARQPTHLLPFFFLQVFDFIISLLTVVGYMSSTSDIRLWLHTKNGSMYVNSTSLTFLLLSISCMVLAFKAYCLGMVWDCYKYLMLTSHGARGEDWSGDRFGFLPTIWGLLGTGRRSTLHRNSTRSGRGLSSFETERNGTPRPPPATYDQTNDLPNYEEALKIPANAFAPPPYFCPADVKKSIKEGDLPTTTTISSGTNDKTSINSNTRNNDTSSC